MLASLSAIPPDPILGLAEAMRADPRADKIDLTVGVYRDDSGSTPAFAAVTEAQRRHIASERANDYLPIAGPAEFGRLVEEFVLGPIDRSVRTVQALGGTGALSIAGGLLARTSDRPTVWLPSPTWPNHVSIFGARGVAARDYRYRIRDDGSLDVDVLVEDLAAVRPGDAVLVHGCCHNPTGVDPDVPGWERIAAAIAARGAIAIVDIAYLGLGGGLAEDRAGLRTILASGVETLVCSSFSKNMGVYRERVGALSIVSDDLGASRAFDHAKAVVRATWSNPPSFGAQVASIVLGDAALREGWLVELAALRDRINSLRVELASAAADADIPYLRTVAEENGMFAMTGLPPDIVSGLREECGIYLLANGRANVAALTSTVIPRFVEGIAELSRHS